VARCLPNSKAAAVSSRRAKPTITSSVRIDMVAILYVTDSTIQTQLTEGSNFSLNEFDFRRRNFDNFFKVGYLALKRFFLAEILRRYGTLRWVSISKLIASRLARIQ
jgi:hypothetical protein